MMTMSKLRYLALALLPLAAGGYLAFGHATGPASAAGTGPGAVLARPSALVAPARVEPVRDPVRLAFEAQGRIAEILVDEGDPVEAHQVLARLDDRLARARVASARAALAAAQARHDLARRGPRREDLAAARADAEAAEAMAAHRGAEEARSEQLGKQGAMTDSLVDADGAAARVATAQAAAARARFQSLARGTRVEQVEEAAAAVALAQADLEAATVVLDQTVLRAPTAGVILRRTAEPGATVSLTVSQPIVELADLHHLELRIEVDEADVGAVAVGGTAYATAYAFGDRQFPVRITRLASELGRKSVRDDDPRARVDTRILEALATFDGAPPNLPVGLRMTVHLAPSPR